MTTPMADDESVRETKLIRLFSIPLSHFPQLTSF